MRQLGSCSISRPELPTQENGATLDSWFKKERITRLAETGDFTSERRENCFAPRSKSATGICRQALPAQLEYPP